MYNLKERLLTCRTCKTDTKSSAVDPKCPACGETLIVVLFSALDGKRITK